MEEKTAYELVFGKLHDLDFVVIFVIFPVETHRLRVGIMRNDSAVRDRHFVSISAEIPYNGGSVFKRFLAIAYPILGVQ